MSNLVIVESPAKARTIKKYLGSNYEVMASMGHIRDLPKSTLGVDIENGFEPKYIAIKGKSDLIKQLKAQAKKSDKVFLATDPDREGEAISWHLGNILGLDLNAKNRVTFNEITKQGVKSGMKQPRTVDLNLVNAQQTRRVLDRIVGYKISPILWKKVKNGLSAGRVQSVAVRLIVDREEEINAFISEEYWTIDSKLLAKSSKKAFSSKLYLKDNEKITTQAQAQEILEKLNNVDFVVENIKEGTRSKLPAPPFTTSTMQQEASKRLGFQAKRTMKAAQELYEGVDVKGMGAVGLITYMRTDSLRISDEAAANAKQFIIQNYGESFAPKFNRVYKSRNNAQDAHEAIRPTMPNLTPEQAKSNLTSDQYKLYKLIWERFIASQMTNAEYNTVAVDIKADKYTFKSFGVSVKFAGFTVLYDDKNEDDNEEKNLPVMEIGEVLKVKEIVPNQHFTQPPSRFTEASLIKALEENGIGRPSTYAPTISTIISRDYIEREGKLLKPTLLGEVTTTLMKENFPDIVDIEFTANMENDLDNIGDGKLVWNNVVGEFYEGFAKTLSSAQEKLVGEKIKIPDEETDVVCELCGRNMVIKKGRFGKFLACPGYPECKNTKPIVQEAKGLCPKCGGKILAKKSKKGNPYYGCENNPKCDFMTWDIPTNEKCPACGKYMFQKTGRVRKLYCAAEGCTNSEK
jgi:DNA topoisomerase-1